MTGGNIKVLTEEQVRVIHQDRRTYKDIAIEYGVSAMTVSNIKTGKAWKHLKLQPTARGRVYKRMPRTDATAETYAASYAAMIESQTAFIEDQVLASSGHIRTHF